MFYQKMDEAEKRFRFSKQCRFLDPAWGLYATAIGSVIGWFGYERLSLIILVTSITISIIGIVLTQLGHVAWMKASDIILDALDDIQDNSIEETERRLNRHAEVSLLMRLP